MILVPNLRSQGYGCENPAAHRGRKFSQVSPPQDYPSDAYLNELSLGIN